MFTCNAALFFFYMCVSVFPLFLFLSSGLLYFGLRASFVFLCFFFFLSLLVKTLYKRIIYNSCCTILQKPVFFFSEINLFFGGTVCFC